MLDFLISHTAKNACVRILALKAKCVLREDNVPVEKTSLGVLVTVVLQDTTNIQIVLVVTATVMDL